MPVSGESSFPRHRPVYRSWIHDRGRPSCVSDDAMPRIRDPVPCACPNRLPTLSPSSVSAEALTDADAALSVVRSGGVVPSMACAMVRNGRMVSMRVRSPAGCNRHAFHANSAIPWTMLALEG